MRPVAVWTTVTCAGGVDEDAPSATGMRRCAATAEPAPMTSKIGVTRARMPTAPGMYGVERVNLIFVSHCFEEQAAFARYGGQAQALLLLGLRSRPHPQPPYGHELAGETRENP